MEAQTPPSPVISIPESEKLAIENALAAAGGERGKGDRLPHIDRTTLYRKMKQYKISCELRDRTGSSREPGLSRSSQLAACG